MDGDKVSPRSLADDLAVKMLVVADFLYELAYLVMGGRILAILSVCGLH